MAIDKSRQADYTIRVSTHSQEDSDMGSKCFCGEVWTNAHPEIMQAMAQANDIAVDGR